GDYNDFYPSSYNSCAQMLIPVFCYFLTQEKFTSIHKKCAQFIQENISFFSWIDKEQSVNSNSDKNDSPNELFKAVCQCICHPKVNRDYQMDILLAIARNQFSHTFLMERSIDCLFYNTFCTFVKQSHVALANYSVLVNLFDLDFIKALLMNEDLLSQHKCLLKRFVFVSSLPTEYSLENQTATQYNFQHKMNYKFLLEYIQKYKDSEEVVSFGVLDELLPLNCSRMLPDFYYETMRNLYMDSQTNDQVKAWIKRMINHGQYTPYQYAIQ
ncbi:MAG: hypothetical protein J6A01_03445, partial [Proteobacteria bacterium]|nr:hypothetical protein [Pseudomonadota bacterium]